MHRIASDWRNANLQTSDHVLCEFAVKLTRKPHDMKESDIIKLREHGFDDRAVHDATQVIAYFNYINRIADALHVEQEDFIRPWEKSAHNLNRE